MELSLIERLLVSLHRGGINQRELAEYLELNDATVSRWFNGHTTPKPRDLRLVAMKCGVPYEWLVRPLGLEPRTHCFRCSTGDTCSIHLPDVSKSTRLHRTYSPRGHAA